MVGRKIREIRKKKKITQRALALAVGIWPQQLSDWELERTPIRADMLWPIAKALHIHPIEFLEQPKAEKVEA